MIHPSKLTLNVVYNQKIDGYHMEKLCNDIQENATKKIIHVLKLTTAEQIYIKLHGYRITTHRYCGYFIKWD